MSEIGYKDVYKALNKAKVKYVVAGGVAVVAHGFTRNTFDLDLIVWLEGNNLEKMFDALYKIGYRPKVPVTKDQLKDKKQREKWRKEKNMIVFSFFHLRDPLKLIDMFITEPFPFAQISKKAIKATVQGITIPIISLEHLKILKQRAGRQKDLLDLVNLQEIERIKKHESKTS